MEDKVLLDISLATAVIGIIVLLLLSFYDSIPEMGFDYIRCEDIGKYVKIKGTINSITVRNTSTSIRLKQECIQDIFTFSAEDDLSINDTITVQGTVQEYDGRLNILADRIIVAGDR